MDVLGYVDFGYLMDFVWWGGLLLEFGFIYFDDVLVWVMLDLVYCGVWLVKEYGSLVGLLVLLFDQEVIQVSLVDVVVGLFMCCVFVLIVMGFFFQFVEMISVDELIWVWILLVWLCLDVCFGLVYWYCGYVVLVLC